MSSSVVPDETLIIRLPLPLAQLYRRAHNGKNPLERHLTAFYLWEASLKLLGAVCVVEYADLGQPEGQLARCLHNLARPSLGHWWEFVRRLLPVLAEHRATEFLPLRDGLLGKARDDLPRGAGLDSALREVLEGKAGARAHVYPSELIDRVVRYRNKEIGHGAAGQRPPDFYDRMGASLLLAAGELLARFDLLAGRKLLFLPDVRQIQGRWLVERFELVGEAARRLESWSFARHAAAALPDAGRVYLARFNEMSASALISMHPLVVYDPEANASSFLNSRRGKTGTEYLCYTTGQTAVQADLGGEQRKLLARALGMGEVTEAQVQAWAAQSKADDGPPPPPVIGPRRLAEYELLSELGRGGMGVVYRAWQPSLGRQVALKSLTHCGDPKAEARFRREIRALGRVEHPHVVKVFASGSDGEQWFYVMELVEGVPLSAVCDRLVTKVASVTEVDVNTWHTVLKTACTEARDSEKPLSDYPQGADTPAPAGVVHTTTNLRGRKDYIARVVELMRQTAEAAHALHERGIVHRDIKPGNIMVSPDGRRATLMDLGLAQLADDVEGRLTRTREFVGTLRYASPQQVLAVSHLDRRSDIYSLGATLWELLALRPLYGATEHTPTPDLMEKIQWEEPARLRRLHPGLSRNLEAVVHKCLEKAAERRYQTAYEFAEDLRRVQDGDPVKARPVGQFDRTLKWIRRHPAPAAAIALLLFTLGAMVVGFLLISLERAHAAQASADLQATMEKLRVRKGLDDMTSEIIGDLLARQRAVSEQQKKFLTRALNYYEELVQDSGDDEATRAGLAAAYLRVGRIRARLGQVAAAQDAFRHSRQTYNQLASGFPTESAYRQGLVQALNNLGDLFRTTGNFPEADEQYQEVLHRDAQLDSALRRAPGYREELARSHDGRGLGLKETAQHQEAEREFRAAIDIRKQLAADVPGEPAYRGDLGNSYNNLGNLLANTGDINAAVREYRAALDIFRQLAEEYPAHPEYRSGLAQSHYNLGLLFSDTDHPQNAQRECRAALAIRTQLAADYPTVPEYKSDLADSHHNLGLLLNNSGRAEDAQTEFRAALALRKRLASDFRTVPEYRNDLAQSHNNLGNLLASMGRMNEAETEARAAVHIRQQLAADFPTVPEYRRGLAASHNSLGLLLMKGRRAPQAEQEFRDALALRERLAEDLPSVPEFQNDVAATLGNLARALLLRGDFAGARQLLDKALPRSVAALEANKRDPSYRGVLVSNTLTQARALLRLGMPDRAMAALEKAVDAGYRDLKSLEGDHDFDALHQRDDFKRLVQSLKTIPPGTLLP